MVERLVGQRVGTEPALRLCRVLASQVPEQQIFLARSLFLNFLGALFDILPDF